MTPQADVALAPLCTIGVGGPARWFVAAASESQIATALGWAAARNVSVYVLGGGSNIVISDAGIDGLVIHVNLRGVERTVDGERVTYTVAAGEPWDPIVARTIEAGCAGLECLSGIPGSVGGTPVQNVGAYGQDVSETITRVRVLDRHTHATQSLSNSECAFGYRTSRFKREDLGRYIVTSVSFTVMAGGRPTVQYADVVSYLREAGNERASVADVREAVLAIRRRKGMVIEPGNAANRSCGSFFVNPVVPRDDVERVRSVVGATAVPHYVVDDGTVKLPAAWLIEHAGYPRGTTRGAVGISPFQAQAIINRGGALAADVLALATEVKRAVWNVFRISIVPEPVFAGFDASSELRFLQSQQRSH